MLKKLGLVELHAALKSKIEQHTKLPAYDQVPEDELAPFYFIEIVDKRPEPSKTMWKESFSVWIHVIAEPSMGRVRMYELIEQLEDALTEEIPLPEPITLLNQSMSGIQYIGEDETAETHAILAFEIKVSYGFKVKI